MCFKQEGAIFTLSAKHMKLIDKFMYLCSSVSSTQSDVNICLAKVWTAINRLSITWKSDQSDQIKWDFFQAVAVSILLYGWTTWMLTKCIEKKLDGNYTRMLWAIWTNPGSNNPPNNSWMATYLPSQKLFKKDKQNMLDTNGEARTNS